LTFNVTVPSVSGLNRTGRAAPWTLALLLPLALMRRSRRKLLPMLALLMMLSAGAFCMSGCGSGANGYFGQAEQNYNVTVTGTSGSKTHTANLTLQVQ
jgi:hypothetical protein